MAHNPKKPKKLPRGARAIPPVAPRDFLISNSIGKDIGQERHDKAMEERRKLEDADRKFADALESEGILVRDGRNIAIVDVISGAAHSRESFRRVNLLPSKQVASTREMRKELQCFIESSKLIGKGQFVVFSGERTDINDYRSTHIKFGRAISALGSALRTFWGWDIFFSNTENTVHRENGTAKLHMHSHCFLSGKFLNPSDYEKLKQFCNRFMQSRGFAGYTHFATLQASGDGDVADSAIRYAFAADKGDLASSLTPPELANLFAQAKGLKFFRPSGNFKIWRSQLAPQKIVKKVVTPTGVQNQIVETAGMTVHKIWDETGTPQWCSVEKRKIERRPKLLSDKRTCGILLAERMPAPLPGGCTRLRPSFLIQDFCGSLPALARYENAVGRRINELRQMWNAAAIFDGRPNDIVKHVETNFVDYAAVQARFLADCSAAGARPVTPPISQPAFPRRKAPVRSCRNIRTQLFPARPSRMNVKPPPCQAVPP